MATSTTSTGITNEPKKTTTGEGLRRWLRSLTALFRSAAIFISHQSGDKAEAEALKQKLVSIGFKDVFLDSQSLHGGTRWAHDIFQNLKRSRALVLLLSDQSRKSTWCFAEAYIMNSLGKVIFPIELPRPADQPATTGEIDKLVNHHQYIKQAEFDARVAELVEGIRAAGIDPRDDVRRVCSAWPFFALVASLIVVPGAAYGLTRLNRYADTTVDRVSEGRPARAASTVRGLTTFADRLMRGRMVSRAEHGVTAELEEEKNLDNCLDIFKYLDKIMYSDKQPPPKYLAAEQRRDEAARGATNDLFALIEWSSRQSYGPDRLRGLLEQVLSSREDNRLRSYVLSWYWASGLQPSSLRSLVDKGISADQLYGVLVILGGFPYESVEDLKFPDARLLCGEDDRKGEQPLGEWVLDLHARHSSRAVHGAAAWLIQCWSLRSRNEALKRKALEVAGIKPSVGSEWYVTPNGITMVLIDPERDFPASFRKSYPKFEVWAKTPKFFISAREITESQYRASSSPFDGERPKGDLSWEDAARFCNVLCQKNVPPLPPAYELRNGNLVPRPGPEGLKSYRLPSEIEWEIAARAGSATMRFYGNDPDLLGDYAWVPRSDEPLTNPFSGNKRPNPLGLFDVYGGVYEWCDNLASMALDRRERLGGTFPNDSQRMVRGGSRRSPPEPHSRTATPGDPLGDWDIGMRVVRSAP